MIVLSATSEPTWAPTGPDGPYAVVWRAGDAEPVAALYREVAARYGLPVSFRSAALGREQYDSLSRKISAAAPLLEEDGLSINAWGQTDGFDAPIVIEYSGRPASPDDISAVGATPLEVAFRRGAPSLGGLGRLDDNSPFWGGARIRMNPYHCTGNFPAESRIGVDYLIVAGHCVNPNDDRVYSNNGALIGDVVASDRTWDSAYVRTSSEPRIYDYSFGAAITSKRVTGMRSFFVSGTVTYCISGSVTYRMPGGT